MVRGEGVTFQSRQLLSLKTRGGFGRIKHPSQLATPLLCPPGSPPPILPSSHCHLRAAHLSLAPISKRLPYRCTLIVDQGHNITDPERLKISRLRRIISVSMPYSDRDFHIMYDRIPSSQSAYWTTSDHTTDTSLKSYQSLQINSIPIFTFSRTYLLILIAYLHIVEDTAFHATPNGTLSLSTHISNDKRFFFAIRRLAKPEYFAREELRVKP